MRWCERCRRRFYDETASFCPFDGCRLDVPDAPACSAAGTDPNLGATLLGQFHLQATLGQGAMGTVYRAWQSGMERPVAVKLLRPEVAHDAEFRRRFLREARAAARLSHPNIVGVHLVGETDAGVPYLVMEHLDGESLEEIITRAGAIAPRRALAIARQVACALAEAHAAGIVHRDLKPANVVLIRRHGTGEIAKILDFGIAKIAERSLADGDASRLTAEGRIFGTPHYISPEQAQGGAIDGRADVYSLGVLLYRLLSGRLPFDGVAMAVIIAHIAREPADLRAIAPGVDPRLAALVMRCLAKSPKDRLTADELVAALTALEEVFDEAAAPAWPSPVVHPVAAPAPRLYDPPPYQPPPPMPAPSRRASRVAGFFAGVVLLLAGAGAIGEHGERAAEAALDSLVPFTASEVAAPTTTTDARGTVPEASTTTLITDGGYAVRAIVPRRLAAGAPAELLFDVWGPDGVPHRAPTVDVRLPSGGSEPALALAGTPGRYRLPVAFTTPGPVELHIELPAGGVMHLHLDVD